MLGPLLPFRASSVMPTIIKTQLVLPTPLLISYKMLIHINTEPAARKCLREHLIMFIDFRICFNDSSRKFFIFFRYETFYAPFMLIDYHYPVGMYNHVKFHVQNIHTLTTISRHLNIDKTNIQLGSLFFFVFIYK